MDDGNQLYRLGERVRKLETELQLLKAELSAYKSQVGAEESEPVNEVLAEPATHLSAKPEVRAESANAGKLPPQFKEQPEFSWEKFVGTQLLSKIGILILVAGVIIGAKIVIDKNLIGSGMKVLSGFAVSAILFFFAWRFRQKYLSFSAVLFAGSMAAAYFMAYAGFVFYHLYPYWLTFLLLLLFTCITVAGALRYNLVVIAQIGLLAAYILPGIIAVKPAHLSNYLAYIAIINAGILAISVLRNWTSLTYTALGWTFLVMTAWFFTSYQPQQDCTIAMIYSLVYLALFHVSALAAVFREKRALQPSDLWIAIPNMVLWLIAANSALAMAGSTRSMHFLLLCAVAALYAVTACYFRWIRNEQFSFRVHAALALAALTLGLMVRVNGENLFAVLTVEAIVFSWLSISSNWKSLHVFSFILLLITSITGLIVTAFWGYGAGSFFSGAFVKIFMSSSLMLASGLYLSKRYKDSLAGQSLNYLLVVALLQLFLFVNARFVTYFNDESGFQLAIGYSLALLALLRLLFRFDEKSLSVLQTFIVVVTGVFILIATILLPYSSLNTAFVAGHYFTVIAAGAIVSWLSGITDRSGLYVFAQLLILWLISYELLFWLNISGSDRGYKLLLSLIWTSYAIFLIYSGIRKRIVGLRVAGMIILGVTVLKLFFYDLSRLSGISKTLVMMAIGGLLLLGAFFYQRFMKEEE